MSLSISMEESHKYFCISDEAADNEWIRQIFTWHGVVVKANKLIDVNFVVSYLLVSSLFFCKISKIEDTIIEVNTCKLRSSIILFHFLTFNIVIRLATELFMESDIIVLQGVHFQDGSVISRFCNC